jgi:hypothetical protein
MVNFAVISNCENNAWLQKISIVLPKFDKACMVFYFKHWIIYRINFAGKEVLLVKIIIFLNKVATLQQKTCHFICWVHDEPEKL